MMEFLVERGELILIGSDWGFGNKWIELGIGIEEMIGERKKRRNEDLKKNGGRNGRIEEIEGRRDGEIEIVISIEWIMMRGGIIVEDVRIDKDGGKRMKKIIKEMISIVEIGWRKKIERKEN